jgi:hypothetical protein
MDPFPHLHFTPRRRPGFLLGVGRSVGKKVAAVMFVLALVSCRTTEDAVRHQAFEPHLSAAELQYIFASLSAYLDAPSLEGEKETVKSFISGMGGLQGRPILVELPDSSTIQVKILASRKILISGYPSPKNVKVTIGTKDEEGYRVSVFFTADRSSLASLVVSTRHGVITEDGVTID